MFEDIPGAMIFGRCWKNWQSKPRCWGMQEKFGRKLQIMGSEKQQF